MRDGRVGQRYGYAGLGKWLQGPECKQMVRSKTNEALMIGVETRTSSPVRILRDKELLQHVTLRGLFPCGEGAGYAGGIDRKVKLLALEQADMTRFFVPKTGTALL